MEHRFEIFADYHQFYVQDDDERYGDLSDAWTPEAVDRMLAVGPHIIGVGTARNMPVPVAVSFVPTEPLLNETEFDRINECSIQIDTGKLVIAGCTDYFPDAARLPCTPGLYSVQVAYRNLGQISNDGLEGDDSYHLFLWPATT